MRTALRNIADKGRRPYCRHRLRQPRRKTELSQPLLSDLRFSTQCIRMSENQRKQALATAINAWREAMGAAECSRSGAGSMRGPGALGAML
jgi:hypothetical protein